ncbi:hypothetical protein CSPX01_04416, partial [Colletotrichum filicis]
AIPAVILWVIIGGPITNYFVDRKGLRIFPSPGVAGISSLWRIFHCLRYRHFIVVHEAHESLVRTSALVQTTFPSQILALSMIFAATVPTFSRMLGTMEAPESSVICRTQKSRPSIRESANYLLMSLREVLIGTRARHC